MTRLFDAFARSGSPVTFDQWANYFSFNGLSYPLTQTIAKDRAEEITNDFLGFVRQAYKCNGPVFACMLVRALLFSEARFQYRRLRDGRPSELFGDTSLELLERPWPGGTTGDLLSRMIQDADLEGNFYATVLPSAEGGRRVVRMRPDWVTIVLGSRSSPKSAAWALDAEVIGYLYHPGGRGAGEDPDVLLPEHVAHFAPIPDPEFRYRGMSWLTPVVREVMGDGAATTHKLKFFENGATPNLVVALDPSIRAEAFNKWIEKFRQGHEGVINAYRTLYLGGGADAKVVGSDMKQIDFKVTQGAGETRIAAAAGVPPVIAGFSEGLAAATYSNYGQARRRFADGTIRPLWRNAAGSLARLVAPRYDPGRELWYDDRDVAFLQEDRKDAATIQGLESRTIRTLLDAGFTPESVIAAVNAENWSLLKHTGLFSVQLQKPGARDRPAGAPPA